MDSIYAIAFGLGLRTLVDAVSQDLKLTGSLIGLWEGVITLHFVKKMPKSSDPYIAYGVRLFIDFLITESMERMVLVLIWTAFGLVLADVTPAIWDEVGLNRVWRHFRRDLYTIYDKIPTVAFFPPQRTVRFLPPREREREREPGDISPSPSLAPSQDTPLAVIPPLPSELSESLKHRVPGYYPGDYSDTDTDFGSINRSRISLRTEVNDAIGTIHYRLSTMPKLNISYSVSDLDEGNQSSAITSPALTQEEIPDMDEVLVDVGIEEVLPVPIPKEIAFPPTPSDSAARWDIHRDVVDGVLNAKPPGQDLPDILDLGEDGGTSDDWEKIQRRDYDENGSPSPPTPPAKDRPVGGGLLVQISPIIPPAIPPVSSPITDNRRESLPPAYSSHHNDDLDDIYYYPEKHTVTATDDHANVNEHVGNDNNDSKDLSKIPFQQAGDSDTNTGTNANPWAAPTSSDVTAQVRGDAEIQAEEAAERKRKDEEESRLKEPEEIKRMEEEKIRKEEEAKQMVEEAKLKEEKQRKEDEEERLKVEEAKRKEEEEAKRMEEEEAKRKEEEEAKRREEEEAKRKEEEEAKRKEEEEAKRKEEEEAKRKEEEEAKRKEAEEAKRKEEEEAKRKEEEAKRKEEEEAKRKEEEAKRKEEEAKRDEEERKRKEAEETLKAQQAEELRREKEAEKKRRADEAAERKKKEDDDNALRKQRQAEAEQKRKDEEAEKRKDAEQKEKEEAERKRQDEAAAHAQKEAEEAEAKLDKQNADTPGDQATEEKEDDSKTVHELDIFGGQPQQGPSESDNVQHSTTLPHDYTEEESVISTATTADPPQEAKVRLERMMILRAQMVEVERRLDELEERGLDETSPEMKAAEKSLRKFQRQAERRHNAGVLFFKLGKFITVD